LTNNSIKDELNISWPEGEIKIKNLTTNYTELIVKNINFTITSDLF